jgi:hypothetical protein
MFQNTPFGTPQFGIVSISSMIPRVIQFALNWFSDARLVRSAAWPQEPPRASLAR